jgi:hypothetical protein
MTDRQHYNPFDDPIEYHQSIAGHKAERIATDRLLTEQEIETDYKAGYKELCTFSVDNEMALSPKNWPENRPADRERWYLTQHTDYMIKRLLELQDAKTYAACNQEWQEKIKALIEVYKTAAGFGFIRAELEELLKDTK